MSDHAPCRYVIVFQNEPRIEREFDHLHVYAGHVEASSGNIPGSLRGSVMYPWHQIHHIKCRSSAEMVACQKRCGNPRQHAAGECANGRTHTDAEWTEQLDRKHDAEMEAG